MVGFKLHSIFQNNQVDGETSGGQSTLLFEDLNQDPLKSAGVLSDTDGHANRTGSFFDIIDDSLSTGWKIGTDSATTEETSVIVIDLNRKIKTSVTGINYISKVSSGGSDNTKLTLEYSEDNSTYTEWFADDNTTAQSLVENDKFLFNVTYRYLRITIFTDTTSGFGGNIDIRLLKINR